MIKYYRVKQDNFLWKKGAIISTSDEPGYKPVENIWDNTPCNGTEYVSSNIVEHENNSVYFERVCISWRNV